MDSNDFLQPLAQERALHDALLKEPDAEIRRGLRGEYRGWYSSGDVLEFCPAKSRWTNARREGNSPRAHAGIDIFAPPGTRISSITSGLAYCPRYSQDLGNVVCVRFKTDGKQYLLMYGHLQEVAADIVDVGPDPTPAQPWVRIRPGHHLGLAGNTGNASKGGFYTEPSKAPLVRRESHVHVELRLVPKISPLPSTTKWPCVDPASFFGMDLRYADENRSFKLKGGKWLPTQVPYGDPACGAIPAELQQLGSLDGASKCT